MKTNCPYCSREIDLEELLMDVDMLAIIKLQPSFGKNASLIWAYCELFGIRPLKTRRKKLRLLLEEMKRLFDAGEFTYQKRRHKITEAGIAEALNVIVHRHWDAHLQNHNYLKKIMIGVAEASAKEERKQADKDLHKKEERLRNPYCEYPYQDEQVEPPTRVYHDAGAAVGAASSREETAHHISGSQYCTCPEPEHNLPPYGDICVSCGRPIRHDVGAASSREAVGEIGPAPFSGKKMGAVPNLTAEQIEANKRRLRELAEKMELKSVGD